MKNDERSYSPKYSVKRNRASKPLYAERICKFCGKSFIPTSSHQVYCKEPHYRTCPVCGKQYIEKNNEKLKFPPTVCSEICRKFLITRTKHIKYMKSVLDRIELEYVTDKNVTEDVRYDIFVPSRKLYIDFPFPNQEIEKVSYRYEAAARMQNRVVSIMPSDDIKRTVKDLFGPKKEISVKDLELFYLRKDAALKFLYDNSLDEVLPNFRIALGLVKNNKIYQCITFGDPKWFFDDSKFQIYNICTKQGIRVDKGLDALSQEASRLGIYQISTFQDVCKFTDESYLEMGMTPAKDLSATEVKTSNGFSFWKLLRQYNA